MILTQPHTWIELSSSAFDHNVSQCKRIIGRGALALVVKSNAYGHGMVPMAQMAQRNEQVDWLCVARLSEAVELRRAHITKPILVLTLIDIDPLHMVNQAIECM